MAQNAALLQQVSDRYGVQPAFIVAFWGIESNYGHLVGDFNVLAALATLAYDGRRSAYFRKELLQALRIVDQGHVAPASMTGSWAGAMGQNQFMLSSFSTLRSISTMTDGGIFGPAKPTSSLQSPTTSQNRAGILGKAGAGQFASQPLSIKPLSDWISNAAAKKSGVGLASSWPTALRCRTRQPWPHLFNQPVRVERFILSTTIIGRSCAGTARCISPPRLGVWPTG